MKTVERDVCIACDAVWFSGSTQGRCPSCGGVVETKKVQIDDQGAVVKKIPPPGQ